MLLVVVVVLMEGSSGDMLIRRVGRSTAGALGLQYTRPPHNSSSSWFMDSCCSCCHRHHLRGTDSTGMGCLGVGGGAAINALACSFVQILRHLQ